METDSVTLLSPAIIKAFHAHSTLHGEGMKASITSRNAPGGQTEGVPRAGAHICLLQRILVLATAHFLGHATEEIAQNFQSHSTVKWQVVFHKSSFTVNTPNI